MAEEADKGYDPKPFSIINKNPDTDTLSIFSKYDTLKL